MDATQGHWEVEPAEFGLALEGQVSHSRGVNERAVPCRREISRNPRRFDCIYREVENAIAFAPYWPYLSIKR
jgi:hypothetical protein